MIILYQTFGVYEYLTLYTYFCNMIFMKKRTLKIYLCYTSIESYFKKLERIEHFNRINSILITKRNIRRRLKNPEILKILIQRGKRDLLGPYANLF